jgi:hypothetical protein
MGAKLDHLLRGRNVDWGFLRTHCWYLDVKGRKTDRGENCIMMNFAACIVKEMLGWLKEGGWDGRDMRHAWGREEFFYSVLVGSPGGKKPLGKHRRIWNDNIKIHVRMIGIDGTNWNRLVEDGVQWWAFVNTVMILSFHKEISLFFDKLRNGFSNLILPRGVSSL